jgi:hypothetical protein
MSEFDGNPIFEAAVALNLRGIRVVPLDDSLERWQLGDLNISPSELWQLAAHYGLVEGDDTKGCSKQWNAHSRKIGGHPSAKPIPGVLTQPGPMPGIQIVAGASRKRPFVNPQATSARGGKRELAPCPEAVLRSGAQASCSTGVTPSPYQFGGAGTHFRRVSLASVLGL